MRSVCGDVRGVSGDVRGVSDVRGVCGELEVVK